jgi:hypothetical protein
MTILLHAITDCQAKDAGNALHVFFAILVSKNI